MSAPGKSGAENRLQSRASARVPSRQPNGWTKTAGRTVMTHLDQRIAAVAHLSIAFGVIIGVGFLVGLAINLVIWLRSKRSPVVEFHAEQAGAFQLTIFLINIVLVGVWIVLAATAIGGPDFRLAGYPIWQPLAGIWCALTPLIAVWYFGTILYGVYGGLLVAAGKEFSYPVFGPWARRRLSAQRK